MDDMWARFFGDLVDRFSGPMKFRLVLQPLMAAFFAIRSGLKDAKSGKPPFFWSLISDRPRRRQDQGRMEECRESVRAGAGARCRVPDHRGALRLSG